MRLKKITLPKFSAVTVEGVGYTVVDGVVEVPDSHAELLIRMGGGAEAGAGYYVEPEQVDADTVVSQRKKR